MNERSQITFERWSPVMRDNRIAYSYVNPADGRKISPGADRWMRAKSHIAAACIATGADTFTCHGGVGTRRWVRVVTVTQDEAEAYFAEAIKRPTGFMVKASYGQAVRMRDRRLEKAQQ